MNIFAEPTWGTSQIVDSSPDAMTDLDSFYGDVCGGLLQMLRYQFMSATNIINPLLRASIWTEDPTTTHLRILMAFDDVDPITEAPGIILAPAVMETLPESDLLRQGIIIRGLGHNEDRYYNFIRGSCQVYCKSKAGGLAFSLGEEVYRFFLKFAPMIREDFNLFDFRVAKAEGPSKPEKSDKHVATVTLSWMHHKEWQLPLEEPY